LSSCRSWGEGKVGRRGHSWAPKVASRKENATTNTTQPHRTKRGRKQHRTPAQKKKEKEKHKNNKKRKRQKRKRKKRKRKRRETKTMGTRDAMDSSIAPTLLVPGAQGMQRFNPMLPPTYMGHKGKNGFIHRSHPHSLLGHKGAMVLSIAPTLVSTRISPKPAEQGTGATMVFSHRTHPREPRTTNKTLQNVGKPHQNIPLLLLHPNGRGTSWFKSTKGHTNHFLG
jgi:hypothetical protein